MNDYQPNQRNRTIAKILQLQRYLRRGTLNAGKPYAAAQIMNLVRSLELNDLGVHNAVWVSDEQDLEECSCGVMTPFGQLATTTGHINDRLSQAETIVHKPVGANFIVACVICGQTTPTKEPKTKAQAQAALKTLIHLDTCTSRHKENA
jgi:hypothetical protein